jgi:hypothetical protein
MFYENYFSPGDIRGETTSGIKQTKLPKLSNIDQKNPLDILDKTQKTLARQGWGVNEAPNYYISTDQAYLSGGLQKFRYRAWNQFYVQLTQDYALEVNMMSIYPFCHTEVNLFERDDKNQKLTGHKQGSAQYWLLGTCPDIDLRSTNIEDKSTLYDDGGALFINIYRGKADGN